jgi:MFS family permease
MPTSLGLAFGPIIWAPISELYGRRWSMLPAVFCMGCFSIGSALSRNATTYFVTRFLTGLFASAPISNVAAALGDIYLPKDRGLAVTFFSIAVVGGPTLGPTIGASLLVSPGLGWRWSEYIAAMWTFAVLIVCFGALPETSAAVLLSAKAHKRRVITDNQNLYHPSERQKPSFKELFTKHFARPLRMMLTEPIIIAIGFYASFTYSVLYLSLIAYPIVFMEDRGWSPVISTLPFLGIFTGVVLATFINIANQPRYGRLVAAARGRPVPEGRLAPMAVGGVLFAIGLWWFGWTARPDIHVCNTSFLSLRNTDSFIVDIPCLSLRIHRCRVHCHISTMYQLLSRFLFDVCR